MPSHWRYTVFVAAVAGASFFGWLGSTRLWDDDEPKNAVCGQEMFSRGDWIVPTFNGSLRTDKPILIYWSMLAVFNVLGVSELASRLPSAIAGVGTVVLTFHLGRLLFDRRAGVLASCLLTSALMFAVLARAATPDSLLVFWITASLTSFVAGVAARRGGHFNGATTDELGGTTPVGVHGLPTAAWICMYIAIGFAVLAKGPIGVVMPLGIIGAYLLFFDGMERSTSAGILRRFFGCLAPRRILGVAGTLHLFLGLPIVALIALPWYISVATRTNGEWVAGFLGTHNIGRFLQPMEHHHGLPIYYPIAIIIGFFPASIFLPVALWSSITAVRKGNNRSRSAAFVLCWIGCYVGFFTFAATKLPNYVVPCYPALALATAAWLTLVIDGLTTRTWHLWTGYAVTAVTGLGIAIGLTITARLILDLHYLAAVPGLVLIVGGLVCLRLLYQRHAGRSVLAFTLTCLAFTPFATIYTASHVNNSQEGPRFAQHIRDHVHPSSRMVPRIGTYACFSPSLVYYLVYPVDRLGGSENLPMYFDQGGDAILMPRTAFLKHRDSLPTDVAILAEEQRFLRNGLQLVLVGRPMEVARGNSSGPPR